MGAIASEIISLTIDCSDPDQRKLQSSASLAFVLGIRRWLVNSPHKGPVTRKMFPFDDVIMGKCFYRGNAPAKVMLSQLNKRQHIVRNISHEISTWFRCHVLFCGDYIKGSCRCIGHIDPTSSGWFIGIWVIERLPSISETEGRDAIRTKPQQNKIKQAWPLGCTMHYH